MGYDTLALKKYFFALYLIRLIFLYFSFLKKAVKINYLDRFPKSGKSIQKHMVLVASLQCVLFSMRMKVVK